MKKFMIGLGLAVAMVQPAAASVSCNDIAAVATKMMQYRQDSVSYKVVVDSIPTDNAYITQLFKAVVDDAYEHKVYQRTSTQIAVINEFTEIWRTACLRTEQ